MGVEQSKSKQKKGLQRSEEKNHDVRQIHNPALILCEGTPVDGESESFRLEEQNTNEDEENEIEEEAENVMTGLPGETTPIFGANTRNDQQDQKETDNVRENIESTIEKVKGFHEDMNKIQGQFQEETEIPSDCDNPKVSKAEACTCNLKHVNDVHLKSSNDNETEKRRVCNKDLWDVGRLVPDYYKELGGCQSDKDKEKDKIDCALSQDESVGTRKVLQEIKVARENFEQPLRFDLNGKFKKKVTSENEDNRCHYDVDDEKFPHESIVKSIFTNVIFLPDKSKGASPKRYGPKRLGSIYDGISEDDNVDDNSSECTADDKSAENIPIPQETENVTDTNILETVAEGEIKTDIIKTPVAKKEILFDEFIKDKSKVNNVNTKTVDGKKEEAIIDQVNGTENLLFVEDHFGLYTGAMAEGISKEFKDERAWKQNENQLGHTVPTHMKDRDKNDNVSLDDGNACTVSHDVRQQSSFERRDNIDKLQVLGTENNTNCQSLNLPTSKFEHKHEMKPCKSKEKESENLNDTLQDQEEVDICKNCKQPRDLCPCLFPGMNTVMTILFDYQKKPALSYLRYLKINEKEINWPILKSAQAIFIKGIKSHNTEISEDNRVAFRFDLPSSKGFFGPDQIQERTEEDLKLDVVCDDNSSMSLLKSIESTFSIDISGLKLTGSIGSYKNIMVNDFDECSDADDEFSEGDDENYDCDRSQCKDNSASEESENIVKVNTYAVDKGNKTYYGKTQGNITENELESPAADKESGFENDHYIEKELKFVHGQQGSNCDGFEKDNCLHLGSKLNMQRYAQDIGKNYNIKVDTHGKFDHCEQFEQLHKVISKEGLNSSNKCDMNGQEKEDKIDLVLVEHAGERNFESFNNENVPNVLEGSDVSNLEGSDLVTNKKSIALIEGEVKCDIKSDECELNVGEDVIKTCRNKMNEGAIRRKKVNEAYDKVKNVRLCIEEDNDEDVAFQSNEGNECSSTVSTSVVRSTGNKVTGKSCKEISRSLKIESENKQEDNDNVIFRQNEHRFSLENDTVVESSEYQDPFLFADKVENLNSLSSEVSVDSVENTKCETSIEAEAGACVLSGHVNDEIVDCDKNTSDFKMNKGMKMHSTSGFKRKQTKIEEDNRNVDIHSDDEEEEDLTEGKLVTKVKEEKQFGKQRENLDIIGKEEERMVIPTPDGSGNITVIKRRGIGGLRMLDGDLPSFLSSGNIGSLCTEMKVPGNLVGEFLSSSDVDFSLPPDEFMKQLQKRNPGMIGHLMSRMNERPKYTPRRHLDRRPRRPETAKSDFATSFYDSYNRNVDISQLDNQPGSSSQSTGSIQIQANDSNAESRRRGSLERIMGERIVQDLESRSMATSSSSTNVSIQSSRSGSPVNFDSSSDETVTEVKLNDMWNPILQEEKNNCLQVTRIPESYRCTVLCVDVSESMQGLPWQQVKQFIPEFLSGLEEKKQSENIEEFVAMVTFGYKTKIVTHPAKHYTQLHKDFKSLKPEGNSPLLPGIALSLLIQTVRRELGQRYCKLHDIIVHHRIILLSDGRPSPMSLVCTSDDIPDLVQQEACQEVESSLQEWKLSSQYTHIDCVPVGSNPNLDMLETICRVTNGRLVKPSDVRDLVNSTHNHYIAAQISKQMFQGKVDSFDEHIFKSLVLSLHPSTSPTDMAEMVNKAEEAQARLLAKQADSSDNMSNVSEEDDHFEPSDLLDLPKIGTRVVPGPDITGRLLQLQVRKGTVTGHSRKHRGKVFVKWDNGVNLLCNCGYHFKFEVLTADDTDQHNIDDKIEVGCKVRRGPDWKYGNQDGGVDQIGTVIKIHKKASVQVQWPNGNRNKYRYNQSGIFDLLISDSKDPFGRQMYECEMNKRNLARTDVQEDLHNGTNIESQFSGDSCVKPKTSENTSVRHKVLIQQKSLGDNSVRPKFSGDNSVRPKFSGDNSVRPKF
ncbi:uncharacterized protein LOC132739603 isoform X2 [Ruditapes philippinarum]|nr:uncharacterized protein LOC132739603 isoform X2 [Ruditapes philippinarum]